MNYHIPSNNIYFLESTGDDAGAAVDAGAAADAGATAAADAGATAAANGGNVSKTPDRSGGGGGGGGGLDYCPKDPNKVSARST